MSLREMNLDEFLGHSTSGNKSSGFLKSWKKKTPPEVDVWLNVNAPLTSLWQNNWPRIVEIERDGVKSREVWGGNFNSWETEELLKNQYKRDRDTDLREMPPLVCPMSIMLEEVRRVVREGEIDWAEELFRFEGDDPSKAVILHAGGMYNAYKKKDMTDDEKKSLKRAGISPKHAWKENLNAKCNYLFRIVDNDNPSAGNQIAIETTSLGEKVKGVIHDAMTALGREVGNPFRNPYCIRWQYNANGKTFNDKYNAIKMDRIQLSRTIEALINEEPDDISNLIKPGNIRELRTSMEAHYVGPSGLLDWDFIFGKAEQLQAELDNKPFYEDDDAMPPKKVNNKKVTKVPELESKAEDDEEKYPCDDCDAIMGADELVCPNCGRDYSEDEEEPPPPPKRTRSKKTSKVNKKNASKGKAFKPSF